MHLATGAVLAAAEEETNNFRSSPTPRSSPSCSPSSILLCLLKQVRPAAADEGDDRRQDFIDRQIKDSIEAKERLEAAEAEYRELLEQTKADASRIREEARAEGRAIIDELRVKAQEEADRVRARGEEQLAAEREQVVAALRGDLGRLATELAERIVGESLDDDAAQSRVVDRFLEDLDAQRSQGSALMQGVSRGVARHRAGEARLGARGGSKKDAPPSSRSARSCSPSWRCSTATRSCDAC